MTKPDFENIKDLIVKNRGSLIRNGIVVMICLLGMGVSLWFFRQDLKTSLQKPERKPVGTVYWINENAKRLSAHRLQWDRLERHSPIYDGDIISSGVFSEVKLSFNNGETLELSENTSVRILYQDLGIPRFVLREGEIQAESSGKALAISLLETAPVEMVNSDLRLDLQPGTGAGINILNAFALKVYQGSGTFSSREGSRTIAAGEALKLGKDGRIQADPPVIMLAPRNGTRLLSTSQEKVPVEFRWKILNSPASGVRLEIAKTRDFSSLEGIWYSDTDSAEIELSAGTYHWKIYAASSQEEADSGRLDIVYTQGPQALSPADGTVRTLMPGKQEILFSWAVPEEAESVVLEVADNSEMNNPRIQQQVKSATRGQGSYSSSALEAGQWYWRIRPVYPGMEPADYPSQVNSFAITESTELPVQKEGTSTPAAIPSATIPHLVFPPDNYTVEASRTPDLLFNWENTFSYNARFQMAERSDFTGSLIKDEVIYGSTIQGPFLKPGTYYWHITGANPGNASPPNRLVVLPALPGPKLQSPSQNERLRIREGEAVIFSWEPVYYANYYQFCLFLEGRELPINEISSLQNNSVYVYFDPNTQGRFRWTVQGFGARTNTSAGRNGLVTSGLFNIASNTGSVQTDQISWVVPRIANVQTYAGRLESSIVLLSPSQGANIPGMQAMRSPPEARWTSYEPLRNIQLIVSRTADPASDPRAIVRDVTGYSVTFPSLDEGVWYWIIRGDTSELRGVTPGDPSWINVLPIPLLPAPIPLYPINRAIGIAQLTQDRNITFRWSITEGANAYIFSLFQDGDPQKLIITAPLQTSVSYVLENLSLLNEGAYLWQVEALSLDRNGVIEQRGRTEPYPFTIEIQRSSDLETSITGTLYGQ